MLRMQAVASNCSAMQNLVVEEVGSLVDTLAEVVYSAGSWVVGGGIVDQTRLE